MDADMLWTAALTAGLGLIGWVLKSAVDEMQRLNILLNKTREEMAKDYVTKADSTAVMALLDDHVVMLKVDFFLNLRHVLFLLGAFRWCGCRRWLNIAKHFQCVWANAHQRFNLCAW